MLFPIALVPYDEIRAWECLDSDTGEDLAEKVREYHIPDFSKWKHEDMWPYLYRWVTGILYVMQCGWEELPGKRLWFLSHHTKGLAIRSEDGKRIYWLTQEDADTFDDEYPIDRPFT